MTFRAVLHIILHVLIPIVIALVFYKSKRFKATMVMLGGLAIDLDHLLADPVYAPGRCSIGFHPLHSYWVMPVYCALLFFSKTRLLGIGLVVHIVLDAVDCVWMGVEAG